MLEISPRVDTLAFLAPQGKPPIAAENLNAYAELLHVTAAPPFFDATSQILNGGPSPDGHGYAPGVDKFRATVEFQGPNLGIIRSRTDLLHNHIGTGIILGLQQAPSDADFDKLIQLYKAGVRVMALEYRDKGRRFGSGFLDREGPLTDDGKKLLEDMASARLILDLSHSGEQTARDALEFIDEEGLELPVMASHGGIFEEFDGDKADPNKPCNLSGATLEQICALGGLVGIYTLTFGLSSKDNSPATFYDQLHKASEKFPDHVAVGSDAVYAERDIKEWQDTHEFMERNVVAGSDMKPRFPDTPLEFNGPNRLELISDQLLADGMDEEQVRKIIGGNAMRFFERALPLPL